ncbi:hypothetical protein TorRG33x02_167820 [Trema orientale]|uniref:Uncharacterized protein n=1 Tax=Trema orientale TaxID=63057 RepID=A0A2P5EPI9_TREOI|nr:hypothetical protein TorRG33x02_167820 [Trema orientale]
MASSLQCNRPTNETCQQKCNGGSSLGQKMSSWVKGHNNNNGQQACKPSCQAQAQTCQTHVATSKTQTHCSSCHTQAHHLTGQGLAKPQQQAQCANKARGGHHTHSHSHSHAQSQTKHHATDGVTCKCVNKSNGHGHKHGHNHGHKNSGAACPSNTAATACEQKKDRNLFGRIKDRLSGHSSCSDSSSSSSDSESDNESCRKRKN